MRRKTFDMILTAGAPSWSSSCSPPGALGLWGYSFANSNVHNQLAQQQITFPPAAAFAHAKVGTEITPSMIPSVSQYAGQQLTTGQQAEAYADDFIAVHLQEIGGGLTYAQLSAKALALPKGSPAYTAARRPRSRPSSRARPFEGCSSRRTPSGPSGRSPWWRRSCPSCWPASCSSSLCSECSTCAGCPQMRSFRRLTTGSIQRHDVSGRTWFTCEDPIPKPSTASMIFATSMSNRPSGRPFPTGVGSTASAWPR